MRGPSPKDPKVRARRNKPPVTSAELSDATIVRKAPKLPSLGRGKRWHERTRAWWDDVWASPMAERYLTADVHGLFVAARLMDAFWRDPTTTLAAELRRQLERFGLDAMSRRRLDWRIREPVLPDKDIEQPQAEEAASGRRSRPDPRAALRVLEGGKGS